MDGKRRKWSHADDQTFLDCWEGKAEELRGCRKNTHVYKEMGVELAALGVTVSGQEIKFKMQNMVSKYKKIKAEMGPSGASPPAWPAFEKLHKIIGGYRTCNVDAVVEDSLSADTQIPLFSLPAASSPSSPPRLSSDSEQPSTSRSSQGLCSGRPQSRTANLDKMAESINKCCDSIESAMKELVENDKKKTENIAAMAETSQQLATKIMEFLNKH